MFNIAFHAKTKKEAKDRLREAAAKHDDDELTGKLEKALSLIINDMPAVPEGCEILVAVQANTPLGGYGISRMVEIAFTQSLPSP